MQGFTTNPAALPDGFHLGLVSNLQPPLISLGTHLDHTTLHKHQIHPVSIG